MQEHAVPAPREHAPPAPGLARFGFALGVVALWGAASLKLAPLGFLVGIPGIVVSVLGGLQSGVQGRSTKLAVAGFVCALVGVVFWLLVRGDITGVVGGRSGWPSWIY
jgi:hypothetical protein